MKITYKSMYGFDFPCLNPSFLACLFDNPNTNCKNKKENLPQHTLVLI